MKNYNTIIAAVVAGVTLSAVTSQAAITLGFSSDAGSSINFVNGSGGPAGSAGGFSFSPTTLGSQFQVDGFQGTINPNSGSAFYYSGITTVGLIQTATVTGPLGTLTINDGTGHFVTGQIDWVQIRTDGSTIGGANAGASIDLTGLTYNGSNADLLALVANGIGIATMSFTFIPAETLTALSAGGFSTTYSGTLSSAVPEPTTIVAGALMLLPLGIGALRSLRKEQSPTV